MSHCTMLLSGKFNCMILCTAIVIYSESAMMTAATDFPAMLHRYKITSIATVINTGN